MELKDEKYRQVFQCKKPLAEALMENYRIWLPEPPWLTHRPDPSQRSTTLFDTVAVYLAMSQDLVEMEGLKLRVTDEGKTLFDQRGRLVHRAMKWKDLNAFEDLLVKRPVSQ